MGRRVGRSSSHLSRATARLGLMLVLLGALFILAAVPRGAELRSQGDAPHGALLSGASATSNLLLPQAGRPAATLLSLPPGALPALPSPPLPRWGALGLTLNPFDQRPRTVSLSARAARAPPSSSATL